MIDTNDAPADIDSGEKVQVDTLNKLVVTNIGEFVKKYLELTPDMRKKIKNYIKFD